MAGGTGGHIFPALAIADELKQQGHEVVWLGTKQGLEFKLVPKAEIELHVLEIAAIRGKGLKRKLTAPFRLFKAVRRAKALIKSIDPDLVIGMGGYVSGPGGLAAWLLRIPLVIHEQNTIPGLTNKVLSRLASSVCESFPGAFKAKKHITYTGNPVRRSICELPDPSTRIPGHDNGLRVLILGGSQGAEVLNKIMPMAINKIPKDKQPHIWHQSGTLQLGTTKQAYIGVGVEARVEPFMDNMAEAYAWADLVICRAGATTVSELTAAGVGSILIPYPTAVDDHQTVNAKFLQNTGAAIIMPQRTISAEDIAQQIMTYAEDRNELTQMAQAAYALGNKDATKRVVEQCLGAMGANKH